MRKKKVKKEEDEQNQTLWASDREREREHTHLLDFFLFLAAHSARASNRLLQRRPFFSSFLLSSKRSFPSRIDDDGGGGLGLGGQSAYNTYVQYPNASFFRTILHLECDPSFGPGSNKYRLTLDCPKLFSKYAGAGAAKSTRETSLINRFIVSFFRTFLPFIRVFFIPLSSSVKFFSSFVFVFVVIFAFVKGGGGGGVGGGFAAKALILMRKLSAANE